MNFRSYRNNYVAVSEPDEGTWVMGWRASLQKRRFPSVFSIMEEFGPAAPYL